MVNVMSDFHPSVEQVKGQGLDSLDCSLQFLLVTATCVYTY